MRGTHDELDWRYLSFSTHPLPRSLRAEIRFIVRLTCLEHWGNHVFRGGEHSVVLFMISMNWNSSIFKFISSNILIYYMATTVQAF